MTDKQCAHSTCQCVVAAGKEFSSDECRSARTDGTACPCSHAGCHTAG